jgi:hypothetical protein
VSLRPSLHSIVVDVVNITKTTSKTTMKAQILAIAALVALSSPSNAEFRRFDGEINAASNYVHYSEGYVVTPGYVDISNLVFETVDDGTRGEEEEEEEEYETENDDVSSGTVTGTSVRLKRAIRYCHFFNA